MAEAAGKLAGKVNIKVFVINSVSVLFIIFIYTIIILVSFVTVTIISVIIVVIIAISSKISYHCYECRIKCYHALIWSKSNQVKVKKTIEG